MLSITTDPSSLSSGSLSSHELAVCVLVSPGPVCIALKTQGTDANMLKPMLFVAPCKKAFVPDLVSYLLLASVKL